MEKVETELNKKVNKSIRINLISGQTVFGTLKGFNENGDLVLSHNKNNIEKNIIYYGNKIVSVC